MTEPDDLAGDLATVNDDEWRTAHLRLFSDLLDDTGSPEQVDALAVQFDHRWEPGVVVGEWWPPEAPERDEIEHG